VDAEDLKALFEPFGPVSVKRMFGGSGIYAEGMCFAIEANGEIFLKTDSLSRAVFSATDSAPFTYMAKGKSRPTSYWSLPTAAHEEGDELRRWANMGLEAARRAATAKAQSRLSARRVERRPNNLQTIKARENAIPCHVREHGHPIGHSRSSRFPLARE
jgi:DNA transformation protein and related proteins